MPDLDDDLGSDHDSLPMNESRHKLPDPAADAAHNAAQTIAPCRFFQVMRLLRCRCFPFSCHQRSGDTALTADRPGRLICHAPVSKLLPPFPLTVPVILPNLGILLVPPVGFPPLFLPALTPAFPAAIRLPPITGAADEEHLPTDRETAKQLSKNNFARHGTPLRSGQGLSPVAS
jgi:hypothetical protein